MDEWTSHSERAAQLDGLSDLEAIASLEAEFSGWMIFRDASLLCAARKRDDGDVIVRAEDWAALRDEIIRVIWRSAE